MEYDMYVPHPEFTIFPDDNISQIALEISLEKLETVARLLCTTAQENFCLEEVCGRAQSSFLVSQREHPASSWPYRHHTLDRDPNLPVVLFKAINFTP